jgi:hypothetical protein
VPPVGGAPSRHTGTGGATAGVHAQCLRDPGAGDTSLVAGSAPSGSQAKSSGAPKQAARQSQTRRCRAEQAAGKVVRRGDAKAAEEVRGPASGRAQQEGRRSPDRGQRTSELETASYGYFLWVLSETQEDLDFIESRLDRALIE